jgi:hypothetical protein
MRKTAIAFILAILGTVCYAQTDNTFYAKQFYGTDVGTKVANAQAACSPDAHVPCIIIIDPSLATFPAGTMPTACTQCSVVDYRNGFPAGTSLPPTLPQITALFSGTGSCYLAKDGSCSTPAGTVPTLTNEGQSVVFSPTGATAGNPIARSVQPDALSIPTPPYSDQTIAIGGATTVANLQPVIQSINNALNYLENACQQAAICIPNNLASTVASTSNAAYILFNPTGASTGPATVSNILPASITLTQTVAGASGAPNFNPGGKAMGQGGWIETGNCGTGPNTIPSGASLFPSGSGTLSKCGNTVTSTSQITSAAAALTAYGWPHYVAGNTTALTMYGASGSSLCWWGQLRQQWTAGGAPTAAAFGPAIWKTNEYELGPGVGLIYNGSAYVGVTFPSSGASSPFVQNPYYLQPESYYQMCMVYNGSTGLTVYMNDGTGLQVGTATVTALGASSAFAFSTYTGIQARQEGLLYIPGVQLTQAQVNGLYGGFNSTNSHNGFDVARNQGPLFASAPGGQWNVHTVLASDVQDCPYFSAKTNGANLQNAPYNATYSYCHMKFTTAANTLRVSLRPGAVLLTNPAFPSVSVHMDGALINYSGMQTGDHNWFIQVTPGTVNVNHTYDVTIGLSLGNTGSSYGNTSPYFTPSGLYSAFGGSYLSSISVPNPYFITPVAESGTVALLIGDSILGSGHTSENSSISTLVPIERYNGGVTNFNTANIASLSFGGALLDTDFNTYPTGQTTGSVPTAAATAWLAANVTPLTGGTPANAAVNIVTRSINDFTHGSGLYGATANCLGIFAFSLKNEIAAFAANNASTKHYIFSPLNYYNFAETAADGCTGDSYTFVNNISNVYEYNGSIWAANSITAGSTITGTSALWRYRAVEADVCASTSNCVYVELGPGAPASTNGYSVPTLSTSAGQCYTTSQQCFYTDNLHLQGFGHWILARFINDQSWATAITVQQNAKKETGFRERMGKYVGL